MLSHPENRNTPILRKTTVKIILLRLFRQLQFHHSIPNLADQSFHILSRRFILSYWLK